MGWDHDLGRVLQRSSAAGAAEIQSSRGRERDGRSSLCGQQMSLAGESESMERLANREPRRIDFSPDRLNLMQITKMVGSHCDDTHTAFRTEPPLTKEVLDCAVTHFFPAGLGDMFSTKDGLLMVARVGIPNSTVQDYARYLTSAEMKVRKQQATDGKKRQDGLQDRANESGLPLE